MSKNYIQTIFFILLAISMFSCVPTEEQWTERGLAPEYVSPTDFSQIYTEAPKESVDQGSPLEYNGYIYINETFKGIHVFDNTDPGNPKKIYFWRIPGNTEFTINEDYLYADNSRHLLTIDISSPDNIKVLNYIEDIYTPDMANNNYPPDYNGRFECVDFDKGIVVGWKEELLDSPRCYRF